MEDLLNKKVHEKIEYSKPSLVGLFSLPGVVHGAGSEINEKDINTDDEPGVDDD